VTMVAKCQSFNFSRILAPYRIVLHETFKNIEDIHINKNGLDRLSGHAK
jgi:hypothetical protein